MKRSGIEKAAKELEEFTAKLSAETSVNEFIIILYASIAIGLIVGNKAYLGAALIAYCSYRVGVNFQKYFGGDFE